MNNCILIGRITKDLELNKTQSNKSYVRFTLAVKRIGDEVDFINCIAWENQAENLVKFMGKGSLIGVEGRIQTGSYETDNGTRYTTGVVAVRVHFLESKKDNTQEQSQYHSQNVVGDETLPF